MAANIMSMAEKKRKELLARMRRPLLPTFQYRIPMIIRSRYAKRNAVSSGSAREAHESNYSTVQFVTTQYGTTPLTHVTLTHQITKSASLSRKMHFMVRNVRKYH